MPSPPPDDPAARPGSAAALFDLLGRRWALRVLWELRDEPLSFAVLHARCDLMSTSVLSQRLSELREAGLVDKEDGGTYALSPAGRALLDQMRWVDDWAQEWGRLLGGATDRQRSST